jgi:SAM-dependent methyltransferase
MIATPLLDLLRDPVDGSRLVIDGDSLVSAGGRRYAVRDGIPRLVVGEDCSQSQTADSFGFKWQQLHSFRTPEMQRFFAKWAAQRYADGGLDRLRRELRSRRRILDAGCGAGLFSSVYLGDDFAGPQWVGLDISAAVDVARTHLGHLPDTHFVQADMLYLPFAKGSFDTVIAEGTLHHTPSTSAALASLVGLLEVGGEILFYVYRRKSPIREFSDDYIRDRLAALPPEVAWGQLRPLTTLARTLAELQVTVDVPEPVDLLGIPAGRIDLQRLLYWHVAKMFWNESLSFEENLHINFDWYHPRYAHRQSEAEIRGWCQELGLRITRFHVDDAGYTVRANREP